MERPADLELGECYDGLAEVAADAGDLELAVRAQRRALEHGCREPALARQMLGWYLLEAGEREEGEAVFAAARAERPDDAWLLSALALARRGAGDDLGALSAFDEALELAKAGSDPALTRRLRRNAWNAGRTKACCRTRTTVSRRPPSPAFRTPTPTRWRGTRATRSELPWSAGPRSLETWRTPTPIAGPSRPACARCGVRPAGCRRLRPRSRCRRPVCLRARSGPRFRSRQKPLRGRPRQPRGDRALAARQE